MPCRDAVPRNVFLSLPGFEPLRKRRERARSASLASRSRSGSKTVGGRERSEADAGSRRTTEPYRRSERSGAKRSERSDASGEGVRKRPRRAVARVGPRNPCRACTCASQVPRALASTGMAHDSRVMTVVRRHARACIAKSSPIYARRFHRPRDMIQGGPPGPGGSRAALALAFGFTPAIGPPASLVRG